jgi:hypothetical protein
MIDHVVEPAAHQLADATSRPSFLYDSVPTEPARREEPT